MRTNTLLWIAQGLLAALFLFAGGFKLLAPLEALRGPFGLPGPVLRFIGTVEVVGAIGLVVPWLTGIRRILTPCAAAGLVVIMIGATLLTAATVSAGQAAFPLFVGTIAVLVAFGRGRSLVSGTPARV